MNDYLIIPSRTILAPVDLSNHLDAYINATDHTPTLASLLLMLLLLSYVWRYLQRDSENIRTFHATTQIDLGKTRLNNVF
jgi:hypothetical protein